MKLIFLGTPDFGVPALEKIIAAGHEVAAAVCQPDKAGSRGKTEFCPVKKCALQHGIPVYQFERISRDGVQTLKEIAPDIMVTAAYGQILSQEVIDIAPHGIINIHGSLLPDLRGAAPIQYAVLKGYTETGITILKTVRKVDAGDIILQKKLTISPDETCGRLFDRMAQLGAEAVAEALELIEKGNAVYTAQDEEKVTFSAKITAEEEKIDWTKPREEIRRLVRALSPSPAAWTMWEGKRLKIYAVSPCNADCGGFSAGEVAECGKKSLAVMCGDGALYITELQAENGKRMDAASFLNGRKIPVGTRFD